jgi:hypothetical protein
MIGWQASTSGPGESKGRTSMTVDNTTLYTANPDVSCREEGPEEGAILFNPDTDAILVINPTGLLIWQALAQPQTQEQIVAHLLENCEDVPPDGVGADVEAFLEMLKPGGFIGEVLESDVS